MDLNIIIGGRFSPLKMAVFGRHQDIVELLINNGADVNLELKTGVTVLYYAIVPLFKSPPSFEILKLLIEKGADVNLHYKNKSMLAYACMHGNIDAIKALLSAGARPHDEDKDGKTPLDYLKPENKSIIEQFIREKNVNKTNASSQFFSPRDSNNNNSPRDSNNNNRESSDGTHDLRPTSKS